MRDVEASKALDRAVAPNHEGNSETYNQFKAAVESLLDKHKPKDGEDGYVRIAVPGYDGVVLRIGYFVGTAQFFDLIIEEEHSPNLATVALDNSGIKFYDPSRNLEWFALGPENFDENGFNPSIYGDKLNGVMAAIQLVAGLNYDVSDVN